MSFVDQPGSPGGTVSGRRLANRNTNRYSVTALFSMAAEQDVEVEDDLARGKPPPCCHVYTSAMKIVSDSPETFEGSEGQNFRPVQEEFRVGTRCALPGFSYCSLNSEQNGAR